MPLLVGVVGDRTDRADARVVDEDVDAAEVGSRLVHGRAHHRVVGHVGANAVEPTAGRIDIKHGDLRTARGEQGRRRQSNTGCATGDDGPQSIQLRHFSAATNRTDCRPSPSISRSTRSPGRK